MKDSPSFFFHEAIPPSVMVGLMAGMVNLVSALLRAETCMPDCSVSTGVIGLVVGALTPYEDAAGYGESHG